MIGCSDIGRESIRPSTAPTIRMSRLTGDDEPSRQMSGETERRVLTAAPCRRLDRDRRRFSAPAIALARYPSRHRTGRHQEQQKFHDEQHENILM
jgi:hypothetical protein